MQRRVHRWTSPGLNRARFGLDRGPTPANLGWDGENPVLYAASGTSKVYGDHCTVRTLVTDRVDVRTGAIANVQRFTTWNVIYQHADPTLTWLASVCDSFFDDGLYIQPMATAK
ncbi:MAG TPA: hypothetical protein VIP11_16615 [Gemmatimonadaceae bacterium]